MAESCSQLDSDPAPPTNLTTNGKRGAEEPQLVCNKKHKIVENKNSYQAELPPSLKLASTTQDAKKASSSSESGQEDEDDNTSKENAKHLETPKKSVEVPPAMKSAATIQDDAERASISNEYEEEDKDDRSIDDHQHLETPKRSDKDLLLHHPMRLDMATEDSEHHATHDTGSKTLFLGNLSFSIEEDDVRDFFKNVGEIAEIRFAIKDDRFMGYGYIEFTTAEAAQEALKLNKEVLLDRRVKLDFSRWHRGAYTPGNSMDKCNQRGGHAQVKTVYVRGFEFSDGFDNIKSALEKHFGTCGEISRLYIPRDYVSGAPKGVAFIEFTDSNGFSQALGLDGSEVGGSRLTVEEAKKPRGEGYGYASGWGKQNGSGGSWVRESRYGTGGGWHGYGSISNTESGSWHGERGYGRGRGGGGGGGGFSSRRVGSGSGYGYSSSSRGRRPNGP
ncbi:hypothetical protein L1987_48582 [Smallanthus sonchifolius]|uniref:Uncharacterized protein n=1 Tax=Smallanthus sonchifolius TaxID=185202 RepID=A0ACB9FRQ9_9ASTR|nr:hypothetical protein L1987_48582 [Smallanthus sonchifolius]